MSFGSTHLTPMKENQLFLTGNIGLKPPHKISHDKDTNHTSEYDGWLPQGNHQRVLISDNEVPVPKLVNKIVSCNIKNSSP